jgi:hypothetical protein
LTPDEVKECPLLWPADAREAEVILVNQHLSAPSLNRKYCRSTGLDVILSHGPANSCSLFVAGKRGFRDRLAKSCLARPRAWRELPRRDHGRCAAMTGWVATLPLPGARLALSHTK